MAIKKLKLSTQADNLRRYKGKIEENEKHDLAHELAKKEKERVIDQFEKDLNGWIEVNTITDEEACNIEIRKAVKHNKLYDTKNNISLVGGPNPTGYEVGAASRVAGTPRWYIHRYIFSGTHGQMLDDGDSIDVHHIDKNTKNNKPRNLLALPTHIHKLYEGGNSDRLNQLVNEVIEKTGKKL